MEEDEKVPEGNWFSQKFLNLGAFLPQAIETGNSWSWYFCKLTNRQLGKPGDLLGEETWEIKFLAEYSVDCSC